MVRMLHNFKFDEYNLQLLTPREVISWKAGNITAASLYLFHAFNAEHLQVINPLLLL